MAHLGKAIIATSILALLAVPVVNVQIASSNSACNAGTSVSIGISNGQVASNSAAVTASGRVADAGNISVTLVSGVKRAVGFGHLSSTSGSGTWRAALCSGTWVAQRN